jgi:hypothetical protein
MKYVVVVVALVVLAFLVMDFNSRTAELSRLTAEHAIVKAELESKIETKSALDGEITYATSEAAVYEWAYENHLIRPGDVPVVPVQEAEIIPTPSPRIVTPQNELTNLERWLLLFIDPLSSN